ncbi:RTA1 like protein-domain-containing protein [Cercophora newfieldiana]|uniref:RTA1 like protein-domain-containing protein n=1 Tax=Cercophora newfieldiana TaxID=92897 RepID=A0AA39YQL2_9PEZI|nr:RTA1 like protein-domain-containing protein [Cercophora newfieldiana]
MYGTNRREKRPQVTRGKQNPSRSFVQSSLLFSQAHEVLHILPPYYHLPPVLFLKMSDGSVPPPPEGYRSWGQYCYKNPSDDALCADVPGFYWYDVSLAANATFVALFGISLLGFIGVYAATRRGLAFSFALIAGVILEILGYAGRIMSWQNRWDENGFLMQICCLTIAPAFLAGGVYLCLRRIVVAFGPENSRIKPETYTRLFIPCDVTSLVLQAVGGAMASIASHNDESTETGDNIMIAGLAFQVFTLLVFMIVSVDFGLNVLRRHRRLGASALDQSDAARNLRNSFGFKGLIGALAIATICIFWRSVFRVAELSNGWDGPLMKRQDLFIGFEGVMIIVACLVLNVFHPSICFKDMMVSEGGFWKKKKKVIDATQAEKGESGASDVDGTA